MRRLPSGERRWTVPDDPGGRDLVVAADEGSVWVGLARSVVRLALTDGVELERLALSGPATLQRRADGTPAIAPAEHDSPRDLLRVRRGSRIYVRRTTRRTRNALGPAEAWLAVADPPAGGRPRQVPRRDVRRLVPFSWVPGETHFAGPGVETGDGDVVHAGTVYDGRGLQPGGSFVVRRGVSGAPPGWVFRTGRPATDLDADAGTVYVAYDDGEIVALRLDDGRVRWRGVLTVGAVPVFATALTVAGPGRLLVGTGDGRILVCSTG